MSVAAWRSPSLRLWWPTRGGSAPCAMGLARWGWPSPTANPQPNRHASNAMPKGCAVHHANDAVCMRRWPRRVAFAPLCRAAR